ncbi:helix-turn-helix domain-containing protein [Allonocardiopsis opalescens]|uniref:Helix-turn-helix protein n=1 Tax=Allonocardiopsis opalescens TaxID=1144618 RepID=A0A2T0QCD9_9ACTN|nr:helix-turn-helix transcriptional regulator [Allonocardiopsis opalescens]PRY01575.1 helix-turn-helix protein [Allonocardiopsis opalescens]
MRSPTVGRWQLATWLARLRAGRPVAEVAKRLRVSTSTVLRWETAGEKGVVPGPGPLSRLLEIYEVPDDEAARIRELREQARRSGWWQPYDLDRHYGTYIGLEAEATRIETYESDLVTGLAQTEGYARAVVRATRPGATPAMIDQLVQVRVHRQKTWLREGGPKLWAILGEAALRQRVGSATIMRDQLRHLIELSDHPRMTLQALPFSVGAHAAMEMASFAILFLDQIPLSTVYTEGHGASLFQDSPRDVTAHAEVFDRLRAAALGTEATRQVLHQLAQQQ